MKEEWKKNGRRMEEEWKKNGSNWKQMKVIGTKLYITYYIRQAIFTIIYTLSHKSSKLALPLW